MRKNSYNKNPIHLDSLPSFGLLRLPDVLQLYPVSKSTWWELIRKGKAPQPVRLSARCVGWRVQDIQALIDGTFTISD